LSKIDLIVYLFISSADKKLLKSSENGKKILKASEDGNTKEVQRLLDKKANPNAADEVWKNFCIP